MRGHFLRKRFLRIYVIANQRDHFRDRILFIQISGAERMILQQFPKNCMKFIEKILVSGVGPSPPGSATEVVLLVDPEIQGSWGGGKA